ncbi:DinB/UmuC family translesion DNA polymerase [Nocardioides flavescens]|uniref:DNA-directed DNA polymerase n=1 Tax=Nocardioides flavescens TaxID=2691959 RepID=A0A6L7F435_9ACTN|nr:DNA polymerase IV [Nocardioides flavescens]MXG91944.1 DNA polymerase IV [Nocardioides flavescens]
MADAVEPAGPPDVGQGVGHWVLHVDLDQFLAAVEVLRRPELAGLPVVVGGDGDPTKRGVVSTASYEARAHGVGSGMPLRIAARKCPEAVFLPVDRPAYDAASAEVMATLRALEWDGHPVVVEVLGWDEAFVAAAARPADATTGAATRGASYIGRGRPWAGADDAHGLTPVVEAGQGSLPPVIPEGKGALGGSRPGPGSPTDPRVFAALIRERVLEATQLHCSVGIGDNKLRAKIATEFGKPRGSFVLTAQNWSEVIGERPTRALWGVGSKTARKLAALGIETVDQLARSDVRVLAAELGPTMGPWYHRLGRGAGDSVVSGEPYVPRAHGRETTFQTDLEDWVEVAAEVRALTERVKADIDAEGRSAARVGLKLRYRPFSTVTRSLTLPEPTTDLATLQTAAVSLLERVEQDRAVRLLGVRLEMVPPPGGY